MSKQRNPNALNNLIPFVKGQSGNPNGRPRKFVTQLKGMGYKVSEINDTIQSLLALTLDELRGVKEDEGVTALERAVASALIKSGKSGDLKAIETLLSRVFGAPKQSFEGTIIEQPLFPDEKPKADGY